MTAKYVLAIDQGTTSSRAILFDKNLMPVATGQQEFEQHFPSSGWVEHDPEDIWNSTLDVCRHAIKTKGIKFSDIVAVGITNQRETVVVWDKATGKPVYNAIVWQDRRTAAVCERLKDEGKEPMVTHKTGLLLDPYFSGTKLAWILDNVEGARTRAEAGELLFGTVDSFLIWRLTGGASHVTDATNAARTLMYNIRDGAWDDELLEMLNIPKIMLPEVLDCAAEFGRIDAEIFGSEVPILGVAGDQQAATIGQACFEPGMLKSTYGTGCFALLNTGPRLVESKNRLLGTIAYQLDGKPTYALEGSIFMAGAVVQWLRDGLELISDASEMQSLVSGADPEQNVILVPAFVGLGAPYWHSDSRGAVFGLTRNTGRAEMAAAALECVGFQTRDLLDAMYADWDDPGLAPVLRVDGGMSANDWAMQFLSDITGDPVDRPKILETTAVGVAWLAGMFAGFYPEQQEFSSGWASERRFEPEMKASIREGKFERWKQAVQATMTVQPG